MNPKVDAFFDKAKKWQDEMRALRAIVLSCGLTEELKWYQPAYMHKQSNVAIVSSFKDFCVISFFKGALLKDTKGILEKPGENTQSGRWVKFTNVKEIYKLEKVLKAYIKEAIEIENAGLKINYKKTSEYTIPIELTNKFAQNPNFKKAFEKLTPGRQRGYLLHFSAAKQSKTIIDRIEKYTAKIFEGKGFNDY